VTLKWKSGKVPDALLHYDLASSLDNISLIGLRLELRRFPIELFSVDIACLRYLLILDYIDHHNSVVLTMDACQCGNVRPGFDMIAVTPKTAINIIEFKHYKIKLYNII
jgi:hypothetical protein